jgi:hypothetical protein
MCGDIIPEGGQVCLRCQNGGYSCPDCGEPLKVMHSRFECEDNDITWNNVFHCEYCGGDWQTRAHYIGEPVNLERKIWG